MHIYLFICGGVSILSSKILLEIQSKSVTNDLKFIELKSVGTYIVYENAHRSLVHCAS